jgi:hypothetical protein
MRLSTFASRLLPDKFCHGVSHTSTTVVFVSFLRRPGPPPHPRRAPRPRRPRTPRTPLPAYAPAAPTRWDSPTGDRRVESQRMRPRCGESASSQTTQIGHMLASIVDAHKQHKSVTCSHPSWTLTKNGSGGAATTVSCKGSKVHSQAIYPCKVCS